LIIQIKVVSLHCNNKINNKYLNFNYKNIGGETHRKNCVFEMKTLEEMRELVRQRKTKYLTLTAAKSLKGKHIQTIFFGYAHQDGTDDFVVGDIVSELEYYRNLKEECFPNEKGHENRAEYWESYMTPKQLKAKERLILLREDGSQTYMSIGYDGKTFCCSDEDRLVSYIEL